MKKVLSFMLALLLVICSISCYAYAETSDLDVAARVKELRNDPVIQEIVERYAPDPQEWWDWYEKLPLEASTGVSKFYILDWLEYFASLSEEERTCLSYDPLLFAVTEPEDPGSSIETECFQHDDTDTLEAKICGTILYTKELIAALMR